MRWATVSAFGILHIYPDQDIPISKDGFHQRRPPSRSTANKSQLENKSQRENKYGYHWWINSEGFSWAKGMFGQFCVVYPKHDTILIMNSTVPLGARPLQALVHCHFPSILKDKAAVQESSEATQQLKTTTSALRVLPVFQKAPLSPGNRQLMGKDSLPRTTSMHLA